MIFYSKFSYGAGVIWWNILVNTAPPILSSSPCNWSPSLVGLAYVPVLLGTILAFYLCCNLEDRFLLWMARRNRGNPQPEHRLWMNVVPIYLVPTSLLLRGVGSAHSIHWFGCMVALFFPGIGIIFPAADQFHTASTRTKIWQLKHWQGGFDVTYHEFWVQLYFQSVAGGYG